jgi:phosphoglycolate phosphatase
MTTHPRALPYRCVIFDLDGTLLDTRAAMMDALNGLLVELGRPPVTVELLLSTMHHGLGAMLNTALDETGRLPTQVMQRQLESLLRHRYLHTAATAVRRYAGTRALLDALQTHSVWMAICSNQDEHSVRTLLELFGLRDYFREVVGGDTFVARKPDPMPLRWLMTAARSSPENTVLVGDSAVDAECAVRCGVQAMLMQHGYGGPNITVPHLAMATFGDLQRLLLPPEPTTGRCHPSTPSIGRLD